MSKTDFEVMSEMANDKNGNQLISMTTDMVSANYTKMGTKITMGIGGNVVGSLLNNEKIPVLYLVDKEEFFKRKKD